jgi:hypothetical protein
MLPLYKKIVEAMWEVAENVPFVPMFQDPGHPPLTPLTQSFGVTMFTAFEGYERKSREK